MTSFGKGLVQGMFGLDGGYTLKLTTGKWYTPSGRSIQKERISRTTDSSWRCTPTRSRPTRARKARPKFKSDGGRVVYGGGAITPDVIVPYDTLTTPEQKLARELSGKNGLESALGLDAYALEMKAQGEAGLHRHAPRCATISTSASRSAAWWSTGSCTTRARSYIDRDARQPDLGLRVRRLHGASAGRSPTTGSS